MACRCSDAGQENSDDNANVYHSAESNVIVPYLEEGLSTSAGRTCRTNSMLARTRSAHAKLPYLTATIINFEIILETHAQ